MRKMIDLLKINLHLFDGGAAAGGDGAGAGAANGAGDSSQGETTGSLGSTRRGKSGEFSNVVFGKQAGAAATGSVTEATDPQVAAVGENSNVTSSTLDDKRKAFQDLINGEYKDIYTEETQRIINRRFKETAQLQATVDATQPVIDMLMQRYDVKGGDIKGLMNAIENDDAYWSEAADEAGMTVDQYKKFQQLQRENDQFRKAEEARRGQQFVQQQTQKWFQEAEAVKGKFPGFDFAAELQNPNFVAMLKSGTPVEHAYKVMHFDELMGNAVNVTAAQTQQAVVANVRARGARPQENGTAAQSPFTVRDDVTKLNRKERAEIARRVARGEIISFG